MKTGAACPVSFETVDHNASRVACLVTIAVLAGISGMALFAPGLGTAAFAVAAVLTLDYTIRAWATLPSPTQHLAAALARGFGIPAKPADKAPKRFACRVGFFFAVAIAVLLPFLPQAAVAVAGALLFFNVLDGVFDFCVGCWMYGLLMAAKSPPG